MLDRPDTRHRNANWRCTNERGIVTTADAQLAVLMDIRDELQAIKSRLYCPTVWQAASALVELGIKLRREKRMRRKRRKP